MVMMNGTPIIDISTGAEEGVGKEKGPIQGGWGRI